MGDKYSSTGRTIPSGQPEDIGVKRELADDLGGETLAMREARYGTDADIDGEDEATADETPETTKHLGDATITSGKNPYAPVGSEKK